MTLFARIARLFTCLLLAGLAGFAVQPSVAATPEAGTPMPAGPVVTDYDDVSASYTAAQDRLLEDGRAAISMLQSGDPALYDRMSPSLQDLVPRDAVGQILTSMEQDRVHFESAELGAIFDGRLTGETIEGSFYQAATYGTFRLTASDATPAASASPVAAPSLAGVWTGSIETGGASIDIEVTFAESDGTLSATLDVPEQNLHDLAQSNVSFREEVPLGDLIAEFALPNHPTDGGYTAEFAWGDASLSVVLTIAPDGTILAMTVQPVWPLPPDPADGIDPETTAQLPFSGVWWVLWGGETILENYHAGNRAQRHAYDILIWNDGGTFQGDGTRNEDYWAWGQEVLAPAAGTVVAAFDELADNTPGSLNPSQPLGNHVAIETADGEYLFLAHLQEGSIHVAEDDRVEAGAVIGLTGNSGNSSEPHLHIHLQNSPDVADPEAFGLPLEFVDYLANGEPVESGIPVQGTFIQNGEQGAAS